MPHEPVESEHRPERKLDSIMIERFLKKACGWFGSLGVEPEPPLHVVEDDEGFKVYCLSEMVGDVRWGDVCLIQTYKVDLFSVDQVNLEFADQNGNLLATIDDDTRGFGSVADQLIDHFPSIDPGWFHAVMLPPFAENLTVLFEVLDGKK